MSKAILIAMSALLLTACGEKVQTNSGSYKPDTAPWHGAKNPHVVKGWTPGDKTSWESQLRTRSQMQNEYVKVN